MPQRGWTRPCCTRLGGGEGNEMELSMQKGRMAEGQNGRMVEWQNGRMAEWRNGRTSEWQNGGEQVLEIGSVGRATAAFFAHESKEEVSSSCRPHQGPEGHSSTHSIPDPAPPGVAAECGDGKAAGT